MSLVRDAQHLRDLVGIPFSEPQVAAITAGLDRPGAIIAGAGSGKTTVMAARVLWLVGHLGVAPERILGLTFTNKAAAELGQRIRASLEHLPADPGDPWSDVTASTYHAFAGSLITEHGLRLGIEPDLQVVTDASRFQRMARVISAYDRELRFIGTHVPTLVGQVMALDSQLSEHLVSPEQLRQHDAAVVAEFEAVGKPALLRDAALTALKRSELSLLVEAYRVAKAADGVMDFSDQMAWGAQLAQLPEVRAAMLERYDVVLLDEYQDTSVAQRDLLQALFSGLPVTAVGDPAQGIYGWRGAATGNLEEFLDDFPAADGSRGRQFALVETRRCAPEVIAAANHLAQPFYASSSVVSPLVSAADLTGRVDVALHRTVDEEIAALVAGVVAEHDAGRPWADIAVLVRVARENGEIVKALRDAHVPFEIVGLAGLLVQPEVLDVVSLLEVVEDVTANPAVLRLLAGPRWNVGPRDLALLGRRAATLSGRAHGAQDDATLAEELARAVEGTDPTEVVSLAEALDDPGDLPYDPRALERFADLSRVVHRVRAHVGEPLLDLARRAVRALDLDVELEAGDVEGASDNLATFLDAVADYGATDRYASLTGLVTYLRAESEFNEGMEVTTPSEADSVKLLTIHRSKGLEWGAVFVPLVSSSVFPSGRGRPSWLTNGSALPTSLRGDAASLPDLAEWTPTAGKELRAASREADLLEELRLGYVAYTRAKERVVVSGHWWGRTQLKPLGPSDFLLTTRDWLVEQGIDPLHWAEPPADRSLATEWPSCPSRSTSSSPRPRRRRQRRVPSSCRPRCRRRRCWRWRRTSRRSRAPWRGRCRASPRAPPGSAPGSTPGSSRTTASDLCWSPPSCRDRATSSSPTTPSWPTSSSGSSRARTDTARRTRSRRPSRCCWPASRWSAASTPSSPRPRRPAVAAAAQPVPVGVGRAPGSRPRTRLGRVLLRASRHGGAVRTRGPARPRGSRGAARARDRTRA